MLRPVFLSLLLATTLPPFLAGCTFNKRADPKPAPAATATAKPAAEENAPPAAKGDAAYRQGVRAYENGRHREAEQAFKDALDGGLGSKADQVGANKYLAFIACANRQQESCRSHFRRALAIDPTFELGRTEAGHPVWGPVFREVKAERQRKG